jgi:oxygen-dependent protoporphyrinogen oxidase
VAGIYTADPEQLSMAATMPEFLQSERELGGLLRARRIGRLSDQSENDASGARYSLFTAPQNGIATITDALASRIPPAAAHVKTRVHSVHQTKDATWELGFDRSESHSDPSGTEDGPEHVNPQSAIRNPKFSFGAIVIAVPAYAAAKIMETHDPELSAALATIEYAGCAVVSLGFRRRQIAHPLDGFGFVVPRIEKRRIIAGSFASQKFPGRAPDDAVLIRVWTNCVDCSAFAGGR